MWVELDTCRARHLVRVCWRRNHTVRRYDDNDPNSVKLSEGTAPSWGSYLGIGVGFLFGVIPCICFGKVIKKLCRRRGL